MNRADRERNAYNLGTLKRARYEQVFRRSRIDSRYLDKVLHEQAAFADGKVALEIGSNAWMGYLTGNIRPKKLYCVNISEKELEIGLRHYRLNPPPFPVEFLLMDASFPAFQANSFDFIFGGAILHHLDFSLAVRHIADALKPGGRILFHEPLGGNPVAQLIRAATPFARTRDERPLSPRDLAELKRHFSCTCYVSGGLSTPVALVTHLLAGRTDTFADRWSSQADRLVARLPWTVSLFREIIVSGVKSV